MSYNNIVLVDKQLGGPYVCHSCYTECPCLCLPTNVSGKNYDVRVRVGYSTFYPKIEPLYWCYKTSIVLMTTFTSQRISIYILCIKITIWTQRFLQHCSHSYMSGLAFYSHIENTYMTASFHI